MRVRARTATAYRGNSHDVKQNGDLIGQSGYK